MGGPSVRDMWGGQGDEQRRWCEGGLLGRKMQRDGLSIPRTPSPSGISGAPCVHPHGDHGNAGRSRSRYGQAVVSVLCYAIVILQLQCCVLMLV